MGQRRLLTPTVKQLLYARRATLLSVDAASEMLEVELVRRAAAGPKAGVM